MGDYERVTRECTLDNMRPELVTAIQAHLERYGLEDVVASVLICIETVSTKQKKKLLGSQTEVEIGGAILTPKWLIWAAGKEHERAGVLSAKLKDLLVEDYETSKLYSMIADTGLTVTGFQTSSGPGSVFIGLGSERAAQKFREMLKAAIAQS